MSSGLGVGTTLVRQLTQSELLTTEYAFLVVVFLFVIARLIYQATLRKTLLTEDYLLYFAFVFYLGACALYITVVPVLFWVYKIVTGQAPMPDGFTQRVGLTSRLLWSAEVCFYTCLWSIKLSLLCLYRKLVKGLPSIHIKIWWAIVTLCFLTYATCLISSFTIRKDLSGFFATSKCYTPEELTRVEIFLFLKYSMNVLTDILIMALPLRLIWNLQMARRQKIAICILFCSGLVCISIATTRIVQIGINTDGNASIPDARWMTLWSVVEMSIAVMIGCCPAFACLVRSRRNLSRDPSRGYTGNSSRGKGSVSVRLRALGSSKPRSNTHEILYDHSNGSQEQLAASSKEVATIESRHMASSTIPPFKI